MKIFACLDYCVNHDASVSIFNHNKLIDYRSAERLDRLKHSGGYIAIEKYMNNYDIYLNDDNVFLNRGFSESRDHHLNHAYSGFYNSNFDDAICFILDGAGSVWDDLIPEKKCKELESVYYMNRSGKIETLYKRFYPQEYYTDPHPEFFVKVNDTIEVSSEFSVGWEFEIFCEQYGFHAMDSGKIMGIAQYYNNENLADENIKHIIKPAKKLQQKTTKKVLNLIKKYRATNLSKNIIISGGYGLNCVSNYEYLNHIPAENIFIDPICFDAGQSIGLGYRKCETTPQPLQNVYIGHQEKQYNLDGLNFIDATAEDISELLSLKIPVSLFQGKSEAGQRALGNRSLLYDPRDLNGKQIVNQLKKRENYRPFAGSVLLEYTKEWFDMRGLKESPYMSFAVNVNEDKRKFIPAVTHADGTCRIQTVSEDQNKNFYDIIKYFHKKTGIPLILNTSFNLAGEPLVETFNDAIETLKKSDINYLFLPEINKLIIMQGQQQYI